MGDIASIIIGVGGLLVAAWSLWISRRGQTGGYREAVFAKQMEAIGAVYEALGPLHSHLTTLIMATQQPDPVNVSPEFKQQVQAEREQFSAVLDKYSWILPDQIIGDLAPILIVINKPELKYKDIDWMNFSVLLQGSILAARGILGVDILQWSSASVIGNKKSLSSWIPVWRKLKDAENGEADVAPTA